MNDIKIICPSKGRAKNVLTAKHVSGITLLVPEKEVSEYRKHNKGVEVIGVPPKVKGITATRQWVLNSHKEVFMMDDDVFEVMQYYDDNEPEQIKDSDFAYEVIQRLYFVAKKMDAKFFGFSSDRQPKFYISQRPLRMTGYINGAHFGVTEGHGLKYDLGISDADDYYISALNAYKNRYCLIDTRYSFTTKDNFKSKGGASTYRTAESMKNDTLLLRETFGECFVLKKDSARRSGVNKGERQLKIPF